MVSRTNKFRGRSRYHGRGKKAGRGAGKRGGRGNAGINKHRLMTRLKYMPNHWGMHGFNRDPSLRTVHNSINVSQVDQMIDEGDTIDLSSMGFDKHAEKTKQFRPNENRIKPRPKDFVSHIKEESAESIRASISVGESHNSVRLLI